jgi:hypothetical protein
MAKTVGAKQSKRKESAAIQAIDFGQSSFEQLVEKERVYYTDVNAYAGTDLDIVASRVAVEITFALSEEIEELNVYSSAFRMGLHRVARWILVTLFSSAEKCAVVPDAIPGYTAMGFKRDSFALNGRKVADSAPSIEVETVERQAAAMIVDNFLGKSKSQVVVVECRDLLLVLFPVPDIRSNLRKLGYIYSD